MKRWISIFLIAAALFSPCGAAKKFLGTFRVKEFGPNVRYMSYPGWIRYKLFLHLHEWLSRGEVIDRMNANWHRK